MLEEIMDAYEEEEFLKTDGFDKAIIGVDEVRMCLVYSYKKMIKILRSQGMTREEAREYFDFNISGAYMGEKTPIYCMDDF